MAKCMYEHRDGPCSYVVFYEKALVNFMWWRTSKLMENLLQNSSFARGFLNIGDNKITAWRDVVSHIYLLNVSNFLH